MRLDEVVTMLTSSISLRSARDGEVIVSDGPGLYSIFIDSPSNLPAPFGDYLVGKSTNLIYVGKASTSLQERLVEQDLRHEHPSTFFRGIGAILGYRPPVGSLKTAKNKKNYKFNMTDTEKIIGWINSHLSILWVPMDAQEAESLEPEVIRELKPLLNTTHNPDKLAELAALRKQCREIACS